MYRKALIVAFFGLFLGVYPAQAQNVTCANRPSTDSSNACANTRFVTDAVNTGSNANYITVTSSENIAAGSAVLCDATAGNITLSLPIAASTMKSVVVTRKDSTANSCVVNVLSGGSINNMTSLGATPQYTSLTFKSDGTIWRIQ